MFGIESHEASQQSKLDRERHGYDRCLALEDVRVPSLHGIGAIFAPRRSHRAGRHLMGTLRAVVGLLDPSTWVERRCTGSHRTFCTVDG